MVFSNNNTNGGRSNHNRLNLRDTSTDPSNIFGDSNLPTSVRSGYHTNNGVTTTTTNTIQDEL